MYLIIISKMEIEINMINVEDGDSIIIEVVKSKNDRVVILIDGGRESVRLYQRVLKRLEEVLKDKPAPDLVVCTHYDFDHIGGLIPIIKKYGNKIGAIWYQKPKESLFEHLVEYQELKPYGPLKYSTFEIQTFIRKKPWLFEKYNNLLELLKHLNNFERALNDVHFDPTKIVEPLPNTFLPILPQFKIIGPTRDIIRKYISKTHDLKQYILNEISFPEYKPNIERLLYLIEGLDAKYKLAFNSDISAVNMLSIICLLTENNDKYLFTGDAGIESLLALNNQIDDLLFLDAPHHGRWNNLSFDLINKMAPNHCFISGSNMDDDPDPDVVECLSRFTIGNKVNITNVPTETWYIQFNNKTGFKRVLE
jgi:beta-lactamase superfamily II metal-dependent hydrolase